MTPLHEFSQAMDSFIGNINRENCLDKRELLNFAYAISAKVAELHYEIESIKDNGLAVVGASERRGKP